MPHAPVPVAISGATLGHPEVLGAALPRGHIANAPMAFVAPKPELASRMPLALHGDGGAGLHSDDTRDASPVAQGTQGNVSKAPRGGDKDAAFPHGLGSPAYGPAAHRECITLHAPLEHRGVIRAPGERHGTTADHQGNNEAMLLVCTGPSNGQTYFPVWRSLLQSLEQHGICQPSGIAARIMEQR